MSKAWFNQRERSSAFWIYIIRWIALNLGRPVARIFLFPIALYFLIFSIKARRSSSKYLARIFNRAPTLFEQFRHFYTFSSTILDRVYLLTGQENLLDIKIHNADIPLEKMKSGQGCILLGSHLGSFEVLRVLAVHEKNLPLKILMYSDHNETITRMLNTLDPEIIKTVIPLGRADTLLKVKESLDEGYSIGMLGDRIAESDKQVECKILGDMVPFPAGPMLLSAALNVPVVLFYGLYKGGRRYDVHFELLTEAPNVSRKARSEVVDSLTQAYAQRLEYYAHQAPYNWFNFYDYWNSP